MVDAGTPAKKCWRCQQLLSRDQFGLNASRRDGLMDICRPCRRERERKPKNNPPRAHSQVPPTPSPVQVAPITRSAPAPEPMRAGGLSHSGGLTVRLVLFDLHFPEHDPILLASILRWLDSNPVDEVILGGDVVEMASCEMRQSTSRTVADDLRDVHQVLTTLRKYAPVTMLEGNHETKLARRVAQFMPRLGRAVSIEQIAADCGATYVPEKRQPIERGSFLLMHGHQFMSRDDRGIVFPPGRYHARKALALYGAPGKTVLYGHGHTPQEHHEAHQGGSWGAIAMGCARTLQPDWLSSPSGWGLEFGVLLEDDSGSHLQRIRTTDGHFYYGGERY